MTGYKSKRAAAQDKVTDIDGHVVRDVRKPRKLPQRPWVGLTDEEICKCAGIDGADTWLFETAYALEAKLKEKNNGA